MRQYSEGVTKKEKEIKFLTKIRNRTKDLKRISWMLKIYLIGIIVASIVNAIKIEGMDSFKLNMCVLIWTGFCLCILKLWLKIDEIKSEKVTVKNGYRMFMGDVRNDEESVKFAGAIFVFLVILSVNRQLIFEEIFLTLAIIPIVINSKLVKKSNYNKEKFIVTRERYSEKKGLV